MKRTFILAISLLLCILLFAGCGAKGPEGIGITLNNVETDAVTMQCGEKLTGFSAVISPAGYEGELTWSSSAPEIVRIDAVKGAECTLVAAGAGSAVITANCGSASDAVTVIVRDAEPQLTSETEPQPAPETEPQPTPENRAALTIHGVDYSREQVTICFAEQYYSFVNYYGEYATYYGLDISTGMEGLSDQPCDYSTDGTWYGYFLDNAVEFLRQEQALCDYARENGVTLSEEDLTTVNSRMALMAEMDGFSSIEDYLSACFGSGVTVEMYREYLQNSLLADKAYAAFMSTLVYSEEELAAHYAEMGYAEGENEYPVTAMRHVLIMAEPDENGEYTDEAIAAAHEEAVRLYEAWCAGEKTEDSFAALADAYSEDGGSVGNGGLYEDIYKGQMVEGIDAWLFDESRAVGDTAVIDNNGSYVGTHIVYFAGFGEQFSDLLALEDLQYLDASVWFAMLIDSYVPQAGPEYESIGR